MSDVGDLIVITGAKGTGKTMLAATKNPPSLERTLRLQLIRLLIDGDGVQLDEAEEALVVVLDFHPVLEGSEIVADMGASRGAGAGQHPLLP